MQLSAEITMYPLQDNYLHKIEGFLEELARVGQVKRQTFPTCTVLSGDYDEVISLIATMMKWSHQTLGKAVFIVKYLPGYEAV
ncbi:MAG: YkoF family thiamine/hydroxymethylpyrimidine-binding protein [Porticoccaceae bacterium]|jgi:uncharacterized protein YqgV (UPF0045/DUF77 family)